MRTFYCIALLFFLMSCGSENQESDKTEENGLAFLVYDRSSSVWYDSLKKETIKNELNSGLTSIFKSDTGYEAIGVHEITASSSVIPRYLEFKQKCSGDRNGNTKERSEFADCIGKKKQWIRKQVEQVLNELSTPPTARATDVFGLFKSVELAITSKKFSNEKIYVYVFSDMVNTADNINLNDLNTEQDAIQRAEIVFSKLFSTNRIKPISPEKEVHFMIINPSTHVVKGQSIAFWNHFLNKWGVSEEKIQWR